MVGTDVVTYRNILVEAEGRISYVTMNRPEKRNALSVEHMSELIDCFGRIGGDRSISRIAVRAQYNFSREAKAGRHHALESDGAEMALFAEGFSARQAGRLGRRGAGRAVRAVARGRAGRTVLVEQSAARPLFPAGP